MKVLREHRVTDLVGEPLVEFVRPLAVVWLFIATLVAAPGQSARAVRPETEDEAAKKRAEIWEALEKELPKDYQQIDAYAENPALTVVLFRSKGVTLRFSLKTGKVEEIKHMKKLAWINRITFEQDKGKEVWVLWHNGQRELTIGAEE